MADLGEEAFSSQMKVVATFLRLLEELMRNKQQDLRYGTKTQRRGILGRMKDFVGGIFKKVYDGTFGRLSRNGKDYGQLDLNDPAVAKLFADTMKQMGMDAMHEDNNLLFSTSDVAKILAFSKMVEQELGKKIEHENDTPEKEQSQEHGQDQERQADARGWSDYPATPEQIDLTATVLAADEGVSIDEIKKDFSENPSIGELQIALEAKGHDTMAIQPDLKNYATPEQRAQLDMLKDKGIIGENELMQLGKSPGQGWCAAWVTNVFQSAGIGYFGGNACDMCRAYCTSTNVRDLKVGMIIADVSHPGTGEAGRLYGHVGIYIGDNKVISNEGAITIKSLQEFVGFYGKGTGCKWGWLGGVDLSK